MSERLTPKQQRELRVRMTGEVQGMAESASGYTQLPRDPESASFEQQLDDALSQYQERVIDLMEKTIGQPVRIGVEDRLRGAIVEACTWLQQGAPGCALQTLENALKL